MAEIDLSWSPSSDNIAVAGYRIRRNNAIIAVVDGGTTSYTDTTAAVSTTYNYTVEAFDAAGNYSGESAPVTVTSGTGSSPPPVGLPKQGISWPIGNWSGKSSSDKTFMLDEIVSLGNGHSMFLRADWFAGGAIDALKAACASRPSIVLMPILSWDNAAKPSQSQFAIYAGQIASQGYTYINLLNEPDMSGWAPATAAAYFNAGRAAIRAVNPSAVVIGPSTWKTSSQKPADGYNWCAGFIGAGATPDIYSIHLYGDSVNLDRSWNNWAWLPDYRLLLNAHGLSAVPIMCTEAGNGQNNVSYQNTCVSTGMDARNAGTIASYVCYSLLNDASPGGFGLYDDSRVKRPAYTTFKSKAA